MHNIQLQTLFIGQKVIYLPMCQSTNSTALEMSEEAEGTVVLTFNQTAGRGQRGNSWEAAPYQNLTFSLILKPTFLEANAQFGLSMVAALGVYYFLKPYLDENLKIKWPNDMFYKKQKICGMLIENIIRKSQIERSVVGIGVNINQSEFETGLATSLSKITNTSYSLEKLLAELYKKLEEQYLTLKNHGIHTIRQNYIENLFWLDEDHFFIDAQGKRFMGKISGIDEVGNLKVATTEGIRKFGFKEIVYDY